MADYCPHCSKKLYEPEWIETYKFYGLIKPYIEIPKQRNRFSPIKINNISIPSRNVNYNILIKILNKKRNKIKLSIAERFLIKVNLDPHMIEEIR